MVDPVSAWTIGMIASKALTMGAKAAVDSAVGEAAKDAYKSLKNWLLGRAGATAEAAIDRPSSLSDSGFGAGDLAS